jgi:hypothetical protein
LKKFVVDDLGYNKPIYPSLGNHEAFPCDMYNPDEHQWIFQTFADIWKDYLTIDAYESLAQFGYYQMLHPGSNLRILATWSSPYDTQNWYTVANNTDPLG